ncbi:hypothetical protein [Chromatium okenii]|jgi:hypothetical protein|uniref:Uncharacterized protein n=1 Tax=Chromatium okenii TaxID=61644 RepID=A0A2S7XN38_9GAMM|nr:hypothetical protein [Chromatium okenii]MBV5309689.1 hypothetical protein [Chromatium okenii]PQJ95140.1 hypothetical protein CXB77_12635 [Chromatium okenii]
MTETKSEQIDLLLNSFADASSLNERLAALTELIKKRSLHAVRDDPRLTSGLNDLTQLATNPQTPDDCLRSVAALARIGNVKSLRNNITKRLLQVLEKPLPALSILKDPEDRYYIATALQYSTQNWIISYAATGIIEEKQGEKLRQELGAVLFKKATTLAQIFHLLAISLQQFKPDTKNPGDAVVKRLERIFAAIRPQAVSVLIEPSLDAGQYLQNMLRAAFAGANPPETQEIAKKAVEDIAGFVHDIARTQISLVTESSLYAAIDTPKSWFLLPEWHYIAEKSTNLQLVKRDIRDALMLLAKQGVMDDNLFEQLVKISGSREAAVRVTSTIVESHPELNTEICNWLKGKRNLKRREVFSGIEESQVLSADPVLATLIIDNHQLNNALVNISDDILAELRLLEPTLIKPLDSLIARCHAVLNDVNALATKRGLAMQGLPGDRVDYTQAAHELVGGHVQGVRQVKIIQPMIVRENADGNLNIVRKALVEKV